VRPTPAALVPLLAAGVLHLLARVTGGGWLSLGAGALLALPLLRCCSGRAGRADRAAGQPALRRRREREPARQRPGGRPRRPAARLVLDDGLLGGCTVAVPALPPGGSTTGEVAVQALARGTADGLAVRCESTGRSAWSGRYDGCRPERGSSSTPCPRPRGRRRPEAARARRPPRPARAPARRCWGVRPWRAGDPVHALHARSTARHGRPSSWSASGDGRRTVLLVGGLGSGPAWEDAVSRAAGLCLHVLRSGGDLLLVGAAPPARPSPASVLAWLAGLEAAGRSRPPT
jgi:hypothetical protein